MAIVSIKRYLNLSGVEEKPGTALALVLQRLGDCAVDWDADETESFREEMRGITGGLSPVMPHKESLVAAESALQALENYNRRVAQMIDRQSQEFQAIIRMLHDSIVKIAGENVESVACLDRIDEELRQSTSLRELQSLRVHLGHCLPGLREEIRREHLATKSQIERLQIEIERNSSASADGGRPRRRVDLATGLPGREDCAAAIRQASGSGTRHYALVMAVNRIEPISGRFGREAGDWMLSRFREFIETQLVASDMLFRWNGPAMVAILERPQAFEQVRGTFKRLLETPINETFDVAGRSVFIPISTSWSIYTLSADPDVTEKQIQKFVASQGCRDFV